MNDSQPAFSCCGDSQERREPSAESAAASGENVESSGTGRVRGLSQKPCGHQGLERSLDLWEVIPDVFGQALALEEGLRMSIEKQQQIEIARVLQAPDTVEEFPDSLGLHLLVTTSRGRECARLRSEGQEGMQIPAGRQRSSFAP